MVNPSGLRSAGIWSTKITNIWIRSQPFRSTLEVLVIKVPSDLQKQGSNDQIFKNHCWLGYIGDVYITQRCWGILKSHEIKDPYRLSTNQYFMKCHWYEFWINCSHLICLRSKNEEMAACNLPEFDAKYQEQVPGYDPDAKSPPTKGCWTMGFLHQEGC